MSEIIPHWLTKQASLMPNHVAIELHNRNKITFKELKENSERFAKKLAALGVKKGTHLGILSSNQLEMVYTIHALSYLGAVGVLLNTRLTDKELNYQIRDAETSFVLLDEHNVNRKLEVKSKYCFSEIEATEEAETSIQEEIQLDDIFTIIYTSGTTGFPKGVIHTYGNHWWSAISSALNLGLHKEDKWLISLPLFHVSGLSTLIKSAIYGMPIYLMKKFDEDKVHEAIMERNITIVSVVTMMVQRLMERLGEDQYPDRLRCFLLGGGPAPKSLLEAAKDRAIPVFQSYGMTETSSQIVTLSSEDALEKVGSAGKALVPAQIKLENKDKSGVGEIIVKGPMVTKGYYKNPEANEKSFSDGWLHTGDLGYFDKEGFLYVVDRRTDLIISGGENIYPSEIEGVLASMPQIKEAGVTGKSDEKWGEVPVAFVVKHTSVSEEEILQFAKNHLAKYKLPKEIHFLEELPRNASNKLVRKKLLQ